MPLAHIVIHVTRPGSRADELLAAVGQQLGGRPVHADDTGRRVHLRIDAVNFPATSTRPPR